MTLNDTLYWTVWSNRAALDHPDLFSTEGRVSGNLCRQGCCGRKKGLISDLNFHKL